MKKILIVEDEFFLASRLKEIILQNRLVDECLIADTYDESVEFIKNQSPDLVLLDIELLNDEDAGIRIAYFLQKNYTIPFIFLSGHSSEIMLKKAKLYQPVTFINKPFLESQVLIAIQMALPEQNLVKTKSVFLKGKFFENITEAQLTQMNFSETDFIKKEICFEDIALVQTYNHIKRNSVLLKFKQPGDYFLINSTIDKMKKILPAGFVQIHQSYIINANYISGERKGDYIEILHEKIPVGTAFKNVL